MITNRLKRFPGLMALAVLGSVIFLYACDDGSGSDPADAACDEDSATATGTASATSTAMEGGDDGGDAAVTGTAEGTAAVGDAEADDDECEDDAGESGDDDESNEDEDDGDDDDDDGDDDDDDERKQKIKDLNGDGNNVVELNNTEDGRFMADGSVEINLIRGRDVVPLNRASASSSCTDCQTVAVAVQINFYDERPGAREVSPVNEAIAVNTECVRCVTVARAIQYTLPVDKLKDVDKEVFDLAADLEEEFAYFEQFNSVNEIDAEEAEARFNDLLAAYTALEEFVNDVRDEAASDDEGKDKGKDDKDDEDEDDEGSDDVDESGDSGDSGDEDESGGDDEEDDDDDNATPTEEATEPVDEGGGGTATATP